MMRCPFSPMASVNALLLAALGEFVILVRDAQ